MKAKRNLIQICLFCAAMLPAAVHAQFTFTTNNGTITITGYVGNPVSLVIPGTTNGYPVTSIATTAFRNRSTLVSVTIPDSVTNIGGGAFQSCINLANATIGGGALIIGGSCFQGCPKLVNMTIPNSVTNIGSSAFDSCTSLTNMVVGSGVSSIGTGAFGNCPKLLLITVDPLNQIYSSMEGVLINQVQNTLIQCPQGKVGGFTIPGGITSIMSQAFQNCGSLGSIIIADSVTSIGDGALEYCGSLTNITMPNAVTNTGNSSFAYCTNLVSATISTNVTTIGDDLFWNCQNLRDVTIPDGVITIGNGAFGNDLGITSVIIPDSVCSIGAYAFNACSLATLVIGNSVTNIGAWAFSGCITLSKSVTIPSSVTSIGQSGFGNDWRVPAFFFQGDAPTNGPDAYWNCHSATAYYLPGTSGWTNTLGDIPAVLWNPQQQTTDGGFGVQNNQFGFNITGTANIPLVVEACTNLTKGAWLPLLTTNLIGGAVYFIDSHWTNYTGRYYRLRSP